MSGVPTRQCVRCGRWFFPSASNAAGRAGAGLLVPGVGPVCNPCIDLTTCAACDAPIRWGTVDYSGTPGWVHDATDEAKCDPDAEDSPDAYVRDEVDA